MGKVDGTGSFTFLSIRPPRVQGAVHPINSPRQNTLGLILTGNHILICGRLNTFLPHLPASPHTVILVSKEKKPGSPEGAAVPALCMYRDHYPDMTSCFALKGLCWRGAKTIWLESHWLFGLCWTPVSHGQHTMSSERKDANASGCPVDLEPQKSISDNHSRPTLGEILLGSRRKCLEGGDNL